jgi:hypothetical protein
VSLRRRLNADGMQRKISQYRLKLPDPQPCLHRWNLPWKLLRPQYPLATLPKPLQPPTQCSRGLRPQQRRRGPKWSSRWRRPGTSSTNRQSPPRRVITLPPLLTLRREAKRAGKVSVTPWPPSTLHRRVMSARIRRHLQQSHQSQDAQTPSKSLRQRQRFPLRKRSMPRRRSNRPPAPFTIRLRYLNHPPSLKRSKLPQRQLPRHQAQRRTAQRPLPSRPRKRRKPPKPRRLASLRTSWRLTGLNRLQTWQRNRQLLQVSSRHPYPWNPGLFLRPSLRSLMPKAQQTVSLTNAPTLY